MYIKARKDEAHSDSGANSNAKEPSGIQNYKAKPTFDKLKPERNTNKNQNLGGTTNGKNC